MTKSLVICETSTSTKHEVQWSLTVGAVGWARQVMWAGLILHEERGPSHGNIVADVSGLSGQQHGLRVSVTRDHVLWFCFAPGGKALVRLCKPRIVCAHGQTNIKSDENSSEPISLGRAWSLGPIWILFGHKRLKFFQQWLLLSIKLRLSQRSRNFNWKPYPVSSLPSWCNLSELQAPLNSLI